MKQQAKNRVPTIVMLSIFVAVKAFSLARALRRGDDFYTMWSATFLLLFGAVLLYHLVQWRRERNAPL